MTKKQNNNRNRNRGRSYKNSLNYWLFNRNKSVLDYWLNDAEKVEGE